MEFLAQSISVFLNFMQRNLFLLLFFFHGIFLFAQPGNDTVQHGIKSIKKLVCGYGYYGDSTGLLLENQRDFNSKGRETREISRKRILTETIADRDEEEPEAEGYYYEQEKRSETKGFDTARSTYNDKLQLVKFSRRDYNNKRIVTTYAYNAAGKCISEVFTRGGKEEWRYEWKYDSHNNMIAKWRTDPGKPAKQVREYTYDSLNRMVTAKWTEYYTDSTVYAYDKNDSLVRTVNYYMTKNDAGKSYMKLSDSTSIARNEKGTALSSYRFNNYSNSPEIVTKKFDASGRCIEELHTSNGTNRRKFVYVYDDVLHTKTYQRYGFSRKDGSLSLKEEIISVYNKENLLIEVQRKNGSHEMLERTVYQYTFY